MFSGTSLALEPLDTQHLEQWRAWINDGETASYLDRVLPVTLAEHEAFYQTAVVENRAAVWFALRTCDEGRYVGNVWLWNIHTRHRKAEVRILIGDKACLGKQYGREAIALLANYAFDKLGLHKLYAYVMGYNPRAVSSFQAAGFGIEATLKDEVYADGVFHDVFFISRINSVALQ